jgi:hypothetical protein
MKIILILLSISIFLVMIIPVSVYAFEEAKIVKICNDSGIECLIVAGMYEGQLEYIMNWPLSILILTH